MTRRGTKGTKGVSCVSWLSCLFVGFVFQSSPADAERGLSVMANLRIAERRKTRRARRGGTTECTER
jgi:hypothetical protein